MVRSAWDKPLFYGVSASDWLEGVEGPEKAHPGEKEEYGWWGLEQTTIFAEKLRDLGIDLLDVSSGGNDPRQQIDVGPKYREFDRTLGVACIVRHPALMMRIWGCCASRILMYYRGPICSPCQEECTWSPNRSCRSYYYASGGRGNLARWRGRRGVLCSSTVERHRLPA